MIKLFLNKGRLIVVSTSELKDGDRFTCFQHGTNNIIVRTVKPKENWNEFYNGLTGKREPYYKIHFVLNLYKRSRRTYSLE